MRNISADIFADEFFGTLSPIHRLLWLGLLLNSADDQGRLVDNVALMRSLLFPYDVNVTVKDIEKGLTIFVAKHKITRYIVGTNGSGKRLIQINNWWRYQKSAQWAGRSQFPAPPKWMDRIRMHSKGNIITLENWENEGGYVAPTKPLRSAKVEATKPLGFSEVNNNINNDVKESFVVVVSDAIQKYREEIANPSEHIEKQIIKLYKESPDNLCKAIDITIEQGAHKFAYLKGVYNNLKKGTQKPEPKPRGAHVAQPRKLDAGRQVRL